MSNRDYIDAYLARMGAVLDDLPRPQIDAAIDLLFEAWGSGKAVYLAGNGGSASTASHFACDLAKWTLCEGKPRFRVLALTDNMPLFSALMNDEGPDSVYAGQVEAWIGEGDVLVLIRRPRRLRGGQRRRLVRESAQGPAGRQGPRSPHPGAQRLRRRRPEAARRRLHRRARRLHAAGGVLPPRPAAPHLRPPAAAHRRRLITETAWSSSSTAPTWRRSGRPPPWG